MGRMTVLFARIARAGVLVLLSHGALGQEEDLDVAAGAYESRAAISELRAQAAAAAPNANDPKELAVFYHKRGVARHRLGNYEKAAEDLRQAYANSQRR